MKRWVVWGAVLVALTGCGTDTHPGQGIPVIVSTPTPVVVQAPQRIDIEKINAHSTLIPLGLRPDGSLEVPDVHHPQQAGWYCAGFTQAGDHVTCSGGVSPGQVGPAVVIGHVDGDHHPGVFYHLKNLVAGDTATVTLVDGKILTFQVYRVLRTAKTEFPSAVVYGDTVGSELRLITCSGEFVGGSLGYADNTIVFAQRVPNLP